MTQLRRALPFVLLVVLVPASASAQGVLRWLGRLSGPGPFWGIGTEIALVCFDVDEKPGEVQTEMITARFPCKKARLEDPHLSIYLNANAKFSTNNELFYGEDASNSKSDAVRLFSGGISADWTALKWIDIGTGFGMIYFAGPRFDNFSRGYVQPVRLAVRPLTVGNTDDNNGWLLLAANWQIILGALDGADFGAPEDPFRVRNEQDVELGVTIDVLRLFRRFKS